MTYDANDPPNRKLFLCSYRINYSATLNSTNNQDSFDTLNTEATRDYSKYPRILVFSEKLAAKVKITLVQISNSVTSSTVVSILPNSILVDDPVGLVFQEVTGCSESYVALKYGSANTSKINIIRYESGSLPVKEFTSMQTPYHKVMFIGETEAIRSVEEQDFISFYSYKGPDFSKESKVIMEEDGLHLQIKKTPLAPGMKIE